MSVFFTATYHGLRGGVGVSDGFIVLGEVGRGRKEVLIGVSPEVVDRGYVEVGTFVGGVRPAIVPGPIGDAALVRARTDAIYTRNTQGIVRHGAWQVIAAGATAWGDAGRLGSHPDVLLAIRGEGAAQIVFSGGRHKGAGPRWLVALDRGADHPSVFLVDFHEAAERSTRLGEQGWSAAELHRAVDLCLAVEGPTEEQRDDVRAALRTPATW